MTQLTLLTHSYCDPQIAIFGDQRAVGSRISCVYPPETVGMNPRGWRVIMFEVVIEMYPPPPRNPSPTVMYKPLKERALTADEIAHFTIFMHPSPRIAIVGSRDFPVLDAVRAFVNRLPSSAIVVSGGARGVDQVAETAARERGLQVDVYPADWDTYGKSAGMRRNHDIVKAADVVVAFYDGHSRGTKNSIELAAQYDKPCKVYLPDEARMLVGERSAA
jgi:hypothetical protein